MSNDEDNIPSADADHDRSVLAAAPALVLQMVAGADGCIDKKEREVCHSFLVHYVSSGKSQTVRDLLSSGLGDLDRLVDEAANDNESERLTALREACEWQLHGRARMAYVKVLMELGQHIAEASGGFLGFGDKVCGAERKALDRLRNALV